MIGYLRHRQWKLADSAEWDKLLYWYVHAFLWGRYAGSTESVLAQDLNTINSGEGIDGLIRQLKLEGQEQRLELYFHRRLMDDTLPLSIGGGIGQSRLCMFYLRKAHIGEIQASIWPEEMRKECKEHNIHLI